MDNMRSIRQIVKTVMEEDRHARNSDSFLYLKVLQVYGKANNLDIDSMSIVTFLMKMTEYGFPPFESVRRTRQLVQARYPELAASDPIDAHRLVREERMRDYVRGAKYEA